MKWMETSYNIGAKDNNAWSGLTENQAVPQAYLDLYTPLIQRNMVRGGKRLAYLIRLIYGDSVEEEERSIMESFLQI